MTTHALLVPPSQGAVQPQRKRKQKSKQRHQLGSGGGGGGGVTVDAMAYLDEIKDTYRDEPEVYREFLALMQDFKSGRTTVTQTITRVAVLFRAHTQLYEGFNSFLPPGYGIVPVFSRGTRTNFRSLSAGGSRSDDSDREDRFVNRDEEEVEVVITTPDGVERRVFR
ncbi:PAH2 domain-containing protein [Marasmius fiardii PR-910]|nr:PAH2 domain-containing protein [Marasmius fiardii PR-910]